jgi:hypothetical protein
MLTDQEIDALKQKHGTEISALNSISKLMADQILYGAKESTQQSILDKLNSSLNVNTGLLQPLTNDQLRAAAVYVNGTFWQNVQPVSQVSQPLPTGAATLAEQQAQTTLLGNISMGGLAPFSLDAGGRTRVSQITTLLDGKILGEDDNTLFENIGTGTATYANNKVTLSVTPGQYMIRQSKRFCSYFSGKNQLVEETFYRFQLEPGLIKQVGYFSSNATAPYNSSVDGFWLESDGDTSTYRLKTSRAGTITLDEDITDVIASYDFTNFSVIAFDFLWLGGAILRLFLKTENGFELIHTFNYSETAQDTFILSPNQPVRYSIRSTTGTGSLVYVCCQVATEGSIDEGGRTLSLINQAAITTNVVGTIYALKGIKKQASFRDTAIQILSISAGITATTDSGILLLLLNPTLSAPITYANKSKIQEGTATNQTVTANTGRLICAVPINSSGATDIIKENFLSFLSGTIDNVMDEYVLAYLATSNNQSIHGVLTVKEY